MMKPGLRDKLERLALRMAELDRTLCAPETASDAETVRRLGQERAEIEPVVHLFMAYEATEKALHEAQQMQLDPEMAELAKAEVHVCQMRQAELTVEVQKALLPKDPNEGRGLYLEIRAGTGGEEAALFAGDLLRMYLRYAERQGWTTEMISASPSDLGGYREVILLIEGRQAHARLKFESGGHRVQRIPVTETQGRIHTSACTVAVLPKADEQADVAILPSDLRIDTFRASGAGGQHINKTDSAVRITHLPTGLVVECQDDRSQHRNKAQALSVLAARLQAMQTQKAQAEEAAQRKSLVGSGDRSERIRTYNFPQGRLTDHRINLTLYKLELCMEGDLDALFDALQTEHQARLLADLAEGENPFPVR
jgi:peptide chain release factor 1